MAPAALARCLDGIKNEGTLPDIRAVLYKMLFDLLMIYGKGILGSHPGSSVTVSHVAAGRFPCVPVPHGELGK